MVENIPAPTPTTKIKPRKILDTIGIIVATNHDADFNKIHDTSTHAEIRAVSVLKTVCINLTLYFSEIRTRTLC